ncbi:MAG TPA: hypothetical protein VIM31_04210 [Candidatus Microsaccharimonas sp.]|jgi:hypothetical protein
MEWIKKNKVLVVGVLAGVVVVVLIILGIVGYNFSVRNEGERQEQDLSALYNQSLNSLSTCVTQGSIAAQVTTQEYQTIKETLVAAVSARYVDANNNPTDASGVLGGGKLISALQENYPQIDQRDWQNLQTLVVGCRDEFQGSQDRIQATAAAYNKWRVTDNAFNFAIKGSFPSNELKVVTPTGDTLYGQSAYDRITRVVSAEAASAAFDSGTLPEQNLFGK